MVKMEGELARYTECTSIKAYIAKYGGTTYMMHFKYSSILVQIYVAFMYGMFIPMLFPVVTLGIANMYICEKIALTYVHNKPPMFDDSLSKRAFRILKFAPILMFSLGYWALGNTAIFSNKSAPRVYFNRSADPRHPAIDFQNFNHTHLALAVFCLWFIRAFCIETLYKICIKKCKEAICGVPEDGLEIGDLQIDERLPDFYDALSGEFQKTWYASEVFNQKHNGIKTLDKKQITKLRTSKGKSHKKIINLPIYDMLHTFEYTNAFFYESLTDRSYVEPMCEVPLDWEGEFLQDKMNMWQTNDVITQYLNNDENRVKPKEYLMAKFDALSFGNDN